MENLGNITKAERYEIRRADYAIFSSTYVLPLVKVSQLDCTLGSEALPYLKEPMMDSDLYENFEAACKGESERWQLIAVVIEDPGVLLLEFVDLETENSRGICSSTLVRFKPFRCDFMIRSQYGIGDVIYWRVSLYEPRREPVPGKTDAYKICEVLRAEEENPCQVMLFDWGRHGFLEVIENP